MPIQKGDLVPQVSPVDELTSFWEIEEIVGEGDSAVVKMKPRAEKVSKAATDKVLVPLSMMKDVKVYRLTDPFATDAFATNKLADDYDSLGTNPRAWARAIAEKHGTGKPLDETALLGWCSRMIEVGAARERALAVKPTPVLRMARRQREAVPAVPRPVRKERKKK